MHAFLITFKKRNDFSFLVFVNVCNAVGHFFNTNLQISLLLWRLQFIQTPYGQSLQILMSLQDILYEQLTVCRTVLSHSWSNCTCPPKFPPVPQNPETPSACINLVHPGGKNPAAANVVPPSKLCPRSSTNFKVMWMPPPLSPYFACLPQLWG